jgi:hypothetical protein
MTKQAINIRLFSLEQIPHPGVNMQKANARPWEQVQLRMPDKRPGGGGLGNHGIDRDIKTHAAKGLARVNNIQG